jgi:hypothetical protein
VLSWLQQLYSWQWHVDGDPVQFLNVSIIISSAAQPVSLPACNFVRSNVMYFVEYKHAQALISINREATNGS